MFDTNVYIDNSAKKISDEVYEVSAHVPYYRSIPLSMINDIKLSINNQGVERETIKISPDNKNWFTLEEAKTVVFHKWEYGLPLRIRFTFPEDLVETVKLRIACIIRTAYIPIPIHGELEKSVKFEVKTKEVENV